MDYKDILTLEHGKPNEKPPQFLYRFHPCNEYSLSNLCSQNFYFNSPSNFNDPFDCNPRFLKDITDNENYASQFIENATTPEIKRQFSADNQDDIKLICEIAVDRTREMLDKIGKFGVACFAEDFHNLLMWSHYADKYTGFCLKFDTAGFNKLFKVKYQDKRPVINHSKLIPIGNIDSVDIFSMYSIKHSSWEYEKEWRAFSEKIGTHAYPPNSLKAILLGPRISIESKKLLHAVKSTYLPHVPILHGRFDEAEFRIHFDHLTLDLGGTS